ncbi:fatty acid--CoA ligase family protein [Cohnella ginsengisoli]
MKYCDEESNRASLTADRWFRSGDLGFLDGNRHLTITGRMKRMVSRGGEKISPIEIERMLLLHADVEDACVVGVPDDLYGEQLCAFIVPRPGRHPTSGQMNESLKPHLSSFKLPKYYIHVSELPLSPTGKVAIAKLERLALESVGELKEYA